MFTQDERWRNHVIGFPFSEQGFREGLLYVLREGLMSPEQVVRFHSEGFLPGDDPLVKEYLEKAASQQPASPPPSPPAESVQE